MIISNYSNYLQQNINKTYIKVNFEIPITIFLAIK